MKTILISGTSSGIGAELTQQLLANGHRVIGLARDHHKLAIEHEHYHPHPIDFSDMDNLESTLTNIKRQHPTLDAIICCAGFGDFKECEQFSYSQAKTIMDVNFLSQALLVKTWLKEMKTQRHGHVIFLGSECALKGAKKASFYAASKFALRGFAQSLRAECSTANIAVSIVNPGLVDTPFYHQLNFKPAANPLNSIETAQVINLIQSILNLETNCVVEEINLQPMKSRVIKKV